MSHEYHSPESEASRGKYGILYNIRPAELNFPDAINFPDQLLHQLGTASRLVLVGMAGVGKTTLRLQIAEALGRPSLSVLYDEAAAQEKEESGLARTALWSPSNWTNTDQRLREMIVTAENQRHDNELLIIEMPGEGKRAGQVLAEVAQDMQSEPIGKTIVVNVVSSDPRIAMRSGHARPRIITSPPEKVVAVLRDEFHTVITVNGEAVPETADPYLLEGLGRKIQRDYMFMAPNEVIAQMRAEEMATTLRWSFADPSRNYRMVEQITIPPVPEGSEGDYDLPPHWQVLSKASAGRQLERFDNLQIKRGLSTVVFNPYTQKTIYLPISLP